MLKNEKVRKVGRLWLGLLLAISVICGAGVQAMATEPVTVTMWLHANAAHAVQGILPTFEEEHPNIKVNLVIISDVEIPKKLLGTFITGRGAPDVVMTNAIFIGKFLAKEGAGMCDLLQSPMNAGRHEKDFVAYLWSQCTSPGGKLLAVPVDIGTVAMLCRKDHFDAVGVDLFQISKTWDDFIAAGKKVTRDLDGDGKMDQWMMDHTERLYWVLNKAHNNYYFDKNGRLLLESPVHVRALEIAAKARVAKIDAGIYRWSTDQKVAMQKGSVCQYIGATWYPLMFKTIWPTETKGKWRALPLPEGDVINEPAMGVISITEQCEHKLEAWTFVEYVYCTPGPVAKFYKGIGAGVSSYKPAWPLLDVPDLWFEGQRQVKVYMDMALRGPKSPFVFTPEDTVVEDIAKHEIRKFIEGTPDAEKVKEVLATIAEEVKKHILE